MTGFTFGSKSPTVRSTIKKLLSKIKRLIMGALFCFRMFLFDPWLVVKKLCSIPIFVRNGFLYIKKRDSKFPITLRNVYFCTHDRFFTAGSVEKHYFHMDIWAARKVLETQNSIHFDIGSRLDGFVSHLLPFVRVTYHDVRPLNVKDPNLKFVRCSLLDLPYRDTALSSVSCLHVLEHIGLGRYGDSVNPDGPELSAQELTRVLAPGGVLLIGLPVGRECLHFDAHRIYDPETVLKLFSALELMDFQLIDDQGIHISENASFEIARKCDYGCGLFHFVKNYQ